MQKTFACGSSQSRLHTEYARQVMIAECNQCILAQCNQYAVLQHRVLTRVQTIHTCRCMRVIGARTKQGVMRSLAWTSDELHVNLHPQGTCTCSTTVRSAMLASLLACCTCACIDARRVQSSNSPQRRPGSAIACTMTCKQQATFLQ